MNYPLVLQSTGKLAVVERKKATIISFYGMAILHECFNERNPTICQHYKVINSKNPDNYSSISLLFINTMKETSVFIYAKFLVET